MDLIRFAIDRPVTVSVAVLLTVLFGLISLGQIPIQLTPNIETTVVSVKTNWEGATPSDVENEIIRKQEEKLKAIAGLTKMFSISRMGAAEITLEFAQGVTKEEALREASDKLREVEAYPENVDEPVVEATNPADTDYIAWVVIASQDPSFDIRTLQDFAEDHIKPEFERVPGISEINVIGGYVREMQVRVDATRLAQLNISPARVVEALRNQNRDASAGKLGEGKVDIRVRSIGRYERIDQIEDTLVSQPGAPVVRVKDVAEVAMSYKEAERTVRNKSRLVLAINAQREVGANVIEVMAGFQEKLKNIRENVLPAEARRLGLKGGFEVNQVYDQTVYIHQAVDLVKDNLWVGGVLTVAVLLVFLGQLRPTLIIALAIPVSVIGTFVAMAAVGRTLNVISLAGLAFAIGMVVDNAIVVLENIDRHRSLGESGVTAAYRAAKEVWGAILASTLTTLCVFIPVLTMQEEAGQLFRDIALAICVSVALSLLVSITVIPSAAAHWMKEAHVAGRPTRLKRLIGRIAWPFARLTDGLAAAIYYLNGSWIFRPLVIVIMAVASIVGSWLLMPPTSYLPTGNRNLVFAMMFTPPAYNLQQQSDIGNIIEERIKPWWQAVGDPQKAAALPPVPSFNFATGQMMMVHAPPLVNFFFVATPDMMFMGGISEDPDRVPAAAALLNSSLRDIPGVMGFATQMPLFRTSMRGSGDALELEISGPDLGEVSAVAARLYAQYGQRYGFMRVQKNPTNFDLPGPEVRIERTPVKDARAAELGLTQPMINSAVQMLGDGAIIGEVLWEGDLIDLKVVEKNAERGDATYLSQAPIFTPVGRTVPLSHVREVYRTTAPQQINRVEEQRAVTLSITVPEELALEEVMSGIREDIEQMRRDGAIPPTVTTNLAGSAAKLTEVQRAMLGEWRGLDFSPGSLLVSKLFLALIITYLLMAALFESWFYPAVIMLSVPLATVGGFLGLRITHTFIPTQQFDVLTMLGFVILIGIVVNNAILLVHQALNLMRGIAEVEVAGQVAEKLPPRRAIAESVRSRVRPIFMTTMTTVLGMLPLVLFPGAGSELYRGLGSVIVGGLLVSTIFTLVLVPLMLGLIFDIAAWIRRALRMRPLFETDAVSPAK